jgi:hypothetical protein
MQNIILELSEYLSTLAGSTVYIDGYPFSSAVYMVRVDPAQIEQTSYLDGSFICDFPFSVYGRGFDATSSETAYNKLMSMAQTLNGAYIDLTNVKEIQVREITLPSLVQNYETGESVYTFSGKINLYKEV